MRNTSGQGCQSTARSSLKLYELNFYCINDPKIYRNKIKVNLLFRWKPSGNHYFRDRQGAWAQMRRNLVQEDYMPQFQCQVPYDNWKNNIEVNNQSSKRLDTGTNKSSPASRNDLFLYVSWPQGPLKLHSCYWMNSMCSSDCGSWSFR